MCREESVKDRVWRSRCVPERYAFLKFVEFAYQRDVYSKDLEDEYQKDIYC